MKTCSKCKIEKELTEFYKRNDRKDGLMSHCKICVKIQKKSYYNKNSEEIKVKTRNHRINNNEKTKACCRAYYSRNSKELNKKTYIWKKNKLNTEPLFKLTENIRNLIYNYIKNEGYSKKSKTTDILGCDFKTLEAHLNDNLYGFTIDDEGLDIDHIIPVSVATTEEEVLKLNHYTNFQLLPSEYNRVIKKANHWDEKHFEQWLLNQ